MLSNTRWRKVLTASSHRSSACLSCSAVKTTTPRRSRKNPPISRVTLLAASSCEIRPEITLTRTSTICL